MDFYSKHRNQIMGGFWWLLAALFLYFVWPTPYEYTRSYPNVVRVNRFTGKKEYATDTGWQSPNYKPPNDPGAAPIKPLDFSKDFQVTCLIDADQSWQKNGDTMLKLNGVRYAAVISNVGRATVEADKVTVYFVAKDSAGVILDKPHVSLPMSLKPGEKGTLDVVTPKGTTDLEFDHADNAEHLYDF